jgi:hypothetical protein
MAVPWMVALETFVTGPADVPMPQPVTATERAAALRTAKTRETDFIEANDIVF